MNSEESVKVIAQTLKTIREVEEKFSRVQENPALNGAENGLTNEEVEILGKLINASGAASIAADEIIRRSGYR